VSCCDPRGCDQFFKPRFARRAARRYRRRGLDRTARRVVAFLERRGLDGVTVLEVGGGIGEIQVELLKRGAASAVNLELSPAYDDEARGLLHEAGLEGRAVRILRDIAVDGDDIEPADVVVLNRVVCCYPDYERLLTAAAGHARCRLVFSYPHRNPITRGLVAVENLVLRLRRSEFRVFAHPPAAMLALLQEAGLGSSFDDRGLVWRVAGLERDVTEPGSGPGLQTS
jgi:magnesium-protoporphyrin O-methyltransferase